MALQLRQVKSDKSLGLFWTGNTLSTVTKAKSFTSFRSAAIDQQLASVSNGIELEVVEAVATQEEADSQASTKLQIINSSASLATQKSNFIAFNNSQEGSANFGP
jgi:predicted ribonuclease toxin of YeeF-YezG toxin-antitoxin module